MLEKNHQTPHEERLDREIVSSMESETGGLVGILTERVDANSAADGIFVEVVLEEATGAEEQPHHVLLEKEVLEVDLSQRSTVLETSTLRDPESIVHKACVAYSHRTYDPGNCVEINSPVLVVSDTERVHGGDEGYRTEFDSVTADNEKAIVVAALDEVSQVSVPEVSFHTVGEKVNFVEHERKSREGVSPDKRVTIENFALEIEIGKSLLDQREQDIILAPGFASSTSKGMGAIEHVEILAHISGKEQHSSELLSDRAETDESPALLPPEVNDLSTGHMRGACKGNSPTITEPHAEYPVQKPNVDSSDAVGVQRSLSGVQENPSNLFASEAAEAIRGVFAGEVVSHAVIAEEKLEKIPLVVTRVSSNASDLLASTDVDVTVDEGSNVLASNSLVNLASIQANPDLANIVANIPAVTDEEHLEAASISDIPAGTSTFVVHQDTLSSENPGVLTHVSPADRSTEESNANDDVPSRVMEDSVLTSSIIIEMNRSSLVNTSNDRCNNVSSCIEEVNRGDEEGSRSNCDEIAGESPHPTCGSAADDASLVTSKPPEVPSALTTAVHASTLGIPSSMNTCAIDPSNLGVLSDLSETGLVITDDQMKKSEEMLDTEIHSTQDEAPPFEQDRDLSELPKQSLPSLPGKERTTLQAFVDEKHSVLSVESSEIVRNTTDHAESSTSVPADVKTIVIQESVDEIDSCISFETSEIVKSKVDQCENSVSLLEEQKITVNAELVDEKIHDSSVGKTGFVNSPSDRDGMTEKQIEVGTWPLRKQSLVVAVVGEERLPGPVFLDNVVEESDNIRTMEIEGTPEEIVVCEGTMQELKEHIIEETTNSFEKGSETEEVTLSKCIVENDGEQFVLVENVSGGGAVGLEEVTNATAMYISTGSSEGGEISVDRPHGVLIGVGSCVEKSGLIITEIAGNGLVVEEYHGVIETLDDGSEVESPTSENLVAVEDVANWKSNMVVGSSSPAIATEGVQVTSEGVLSDALKDTEGVQLKSEGVGSGILVGSEGGQLTCEDVVRDVLAETEGVHLASESVLSDVLAETDGVWLASESVASLVLAGTETEEVQLTSNSVVRDVLAETEGLQLPSESAVSDDLAETEGVQLTKSVVSDVLAAVEVHIELEKDMPVNALTQLVTTAPDKQFGLVVLNDDKSLEIEKTTSATPELDNLGKEQQQCSDNTVRIELAYEQPEQDRRNNLPGTSVALSVEFVEAAANPVNISLPKTNSPAIVVDNKASLSHISPSIMGVEELAILQGKNGMPAEDCVTITGLALKTAKFEDISLRSDVGTGLDASVLNADPLASVEPCISVDAVLDGREDSSRGEALGKSDRKRGREEGSVAEDLNEKTSKTYKKIPNGESEVKIGVDPEGVKVDKKRSRDESEDTMTETGVSLSKRKSSKTGLDDEGDIGGAEQEKDNIESFDEKTEKQGVKVDSVKEGKVSNVTRFKKRKIALFLGYCGVGYQGMQKNPGAVTIEGELEEALFRSGAIAETNYGDPKKLDWRRAARTDKGVSAVGQVVSGTFFIDPPGLIERLNSHLPKQIRVYGYKRVTASFNAKKLCDRRKYEYVLPIYAFDPSVHLDRASVRAQTETASKAAVTITNVSKAAVNITSVGEVGIAKLNNIEMTEDCIAKVKGEPVAVIDNEMRENSIGVEKVNGGSAAAGVVDNELNEGSISEDKGIVGGVETSDGVEPIAEIMISSSLQQDFVSSHDKGLGSTPQVLTEKVVITKEASSRVLPSEIGQGGPLLLDVSSSSVLQLEKIAEGAVGEDATLMMGTVAVTAEMEKIDASGMVGDEMDVVVETVVPPVGTEMEVEITPEEKKQALDEKIKNSKFKFDEEASKRLNRILHSYVGHHNFHNFTVRTNANDPSANRYIVSFDAENVFTADGTEFVRCTVVGQSFMLHQIRKMIGLAVAIMRGYAPDSFVDTALRRDTKVNVPMAPELGLFLEECYYSSYNRRWHATHEEISLNSYTKDADDFKREFIYPHIVSTEARDSTFALWLHSINDRHFPDLVAARSHDQEKSY